MRSESWVILEITSRGEEAVKAMYVKSSLAEKSPFKEGDIFIPIVKHGGKPVWMMEVISSSSQDTVHLTTSISREHT